MAYSDAEAAQAPPGALCITAESKAPETAAPQGSYLFRHLNGRVYGWGDQRWVRYDHAEVFFDARRNEARVKSADPNLLYHYTYYLIIAVTGIALDRQGLHRFHSLGVFINGSTLLFPMPVSGGKTTLALALLTDPEVLLYSEDTPLIDRQGRVHSFPLSLVLRAPQAAGFDAKHVRRKDDPVFGDKFLLDIDHFGRHRICAGAGAGAVLLWGLKSSVEQPGAIPIAAPRALWLLLYFIVLGKDCPQRAEIVLRLSPAGLWDTAGILLRRAAAAIQLWRQSRSYWFQMSPDIARNAAWVKEFARNRPAARPAQGRRARPVY